MKKINLAVLLILIITSNYSFASESGRILSPDGKSYFFYKSSTENIAKLFVYNSMMKKIVMVGETFLRYSVLNDNDVTWHNSDLLEVNIKTGSPGNYSIFYSVVLDKVSGEYYFPIAVDSNNRFLLVGDEEVYIVSIFNSDNKYQINENFQKTAIKFLIFNREKTFFDDSGNLHIFFLNDKDRWIDKFINGNDILLKMQKK